MSDIPSLAILLPGLLGVIAAALAANAARFCLRAAASWLAGLRPAAGWFDDVFLNASAAFLFFTFALVASA